MRPSHKRDVLEGECARDLSQLAWENRCAQGVDSAILRQAVPAPGTATVQRRFPQRDPQRRAAAPRQGGRRDSFPAASQAMRGGASCSARGALRRPLLVPPSRAALSPLWRREALRQPRPCDAEVLPALYSCALTPSTFSPPSRGGASCRDPRVWRRSSAERECLPTPSKRHSDELLWSREDEQEPDVRVAPLRGEPGT